MTETAENKSDSPSRKVDFGDDEAMVEATEAEESIVFEEKDVRDDRSEADSEDWETSLKEISAKFGDSGRMDRSSKSGINADNNITTVRARRRSVSERNQEIIQNELSELSGLASHKNEVEKDNRIMARTLDEIGSHGYGLEGVSVWLFDHENDHLIPKGWWHSPSMPKSKALDRLFDPSKAGYVPQYPVLPGVDLPGILWNEADGYDMAGEERRSARSSIMEVLTSSRHSAARSSIFDLSRRSRRSSTATPKQSRRKSSMSDFLFHSTGEVEVLNWRDIKSLVDDPDTARGPRLALMEEAGFSRASGITFKNEICMGIVIYYISEGLDHETLHSLSNTAYLKQSTQMIGSTASMVKTRRARVGHLIKKGLSQKLETQKTTIDDSSKTKQEEDKQERCPLVPTRVKKLPTKISGGSMQIPPAPNASFAMWTTLGSFCGLLALSALNEFFQYVTKDEYYLIIGPFGALMTLQYGLTAAPASQPRNAIFGQALAGATSLAFTYIPESVLALWLRQAIAPAIAIGLMVKCGVTHPPAGAHAVLLSSGEYSWVLYGIGLFGTLVSIIPATLVNNLSLKRQYPTYWFAIPEWQKKWVQKTTVLASKNMQTPKRKGGKSDSSSSEEEEV